MDGLGPIEYAAVQRVLDEEGLRGYVREQTETILSRLDSAFRVEAQRASKERMKSRQSKSKGRRRG